MCSIDSIRLHMHASTAAFDIEGLARFLLGPVVPSLDGQRKGHCVASVKEHAAESCCQGSSPACAIPIHIALGGLCVRGGPVLILRTSITRAEVYWLRCTKVQTRQIVRPRLVVARRKRERSPAQPVACCPSTSARTWASLCASLHRRWPPRSQSPPPQTRCHPQSAGATAARFSLSSLAQLDS